MGYGELCWGGFAVNERGMGGREEERERRGREDNLGQFLSSG